MHLLIRPWRRRPDHGVSRGVRLTPMLQRTLGILLILAGASFVITSQGWGFKLIGLVGPERALGTPNVHRNPNGSYDMTNPYGMALFCLPFLIAGIGLIVLGIKIIRRRQIGA